MARSKISPQIQLSLRYESILPQTSFVGITGEPVGEEKWDVLVNYRGDIMPIAEELGFEIQDLGYRFALVNISKNLIEPLSNYENVAYIEFPEVMTYILENSLTSICITENVIGALYGNLSGKGILVAVIDSGINYSHEAFTRPDNTSRIRFLWDQNIQGTPPEGFKVGTEYTNAQINEALRQPTKEEQLAIVPSQDVLGHGTAIAGIAAGGGRRDTQRYRGVAIQSELLIVKLKTSEGVETPLKGPRNVDVMLGLKYVAEKATELKMPVSVIVGLGVNEGGHDGKGNIETYIDRVVSTNKMCFSIGAGNEANKDSHTQGIIRQGEEKTVQIFVDKDQPYYFFTLWKGFADTFSIQIQSPSGKITEELTDIVNNRAFVFDNTLVLVNFSEPSEAGTDQQILLFLEKFNSDSINPGIWNVIIRGKDIVQGNYDIWGSSTDPAVRGTRFIDPDPDRTVMRSGTAAFATTVGAFNDLTNQILNFSGRGYTRDGRVKPDLVAPGYNIMAPGIQSDIAYSPVTGTSAAAAFMCGSYAMLMQYGIIENNDPFLYGERLKAYCLKNTTKLPQYAPYPNRQWGYGILCVEKVLKELAERYKT